MAALWKDDKESTWYWTQNGANMAASSEFGNPQKGDKVTSDQMDKMVSRKIFDEVVAAGCLTQAMTPGDRVVSKVELADWRPRPLKVGEVGIVKSVDNDKDDSILVVFDGQPPLEGLLRPENLQKVPLVAGVPLGMRPGQVVYRPAPIGQMFQNTIPGGAQPGQLLQVQGGVPQLVQNPERAQLRGMSQSKLRKRAIADGVDRSSLDKADNANDTKAALIDFILATAAAKAQFEVGDRVRMRDFGGKIWYTGVVKSVSPLKICREDNPDATGYVWDEVEKLEIPEVTKKDAEVDAALEAQKQAAAAAPEEHKEAAAKADAGSTEALEANKASAHANEIPNDAKAAEADAQAAAVGGNLMLSHHGGHLNLNYSSEEQKQALEATKAAANANQIPNDAKPAEADAQAREATKAEAHANQPPIQAASDANAEKDTKSAKKNTQEKRDQSKGRSKGGKERDQSKGRRYRQR